MLRCKQIFEFRCNPPITDRVFDHEFYRLHHHTAESATSDPVIFAHLPSRSIMAISPNNRMPLSLRSPINDPSNAGTSDFTDPNSPLTRHAHTPKLSGLPWIWYQALLNIRIFVHEIWGIIRSEFERAPMKKFCDSEIFVWLFWTDTSLSFFPDHTERISGFRDIFELFVPGKQKRMILDDFSVITNPSDLDAIYKEIHCFCPAGKGKT